MFNGILFSRLLESLSMVHAFISAGERFVAKTYFSIFNHSFFLVDKILGKLVNNTFFGCLKKYCGFVNSLVDSSLLVLMQIFDKCS